ncbi:L-piperidine-6-carboxylate dehydrogenase [Actinoplanes regularis]|uniref:aldehyde dehydrogenase (NAD(+)) n=1 Tax=Actinoplanes regularis TaxID=52697 RepID=A0A239CWT6_9ACTN|nr:aldehyde dehydrogenase family protein [Actinoplanes regularis]GIE88567.1 aldehyde dehydrogenase [Actinoplanes regularis]SNS23823.1 delta-1-piperideine-6-carboxylate dehydrogenase [Actinoplanes regularis]
MSTDELRERALASLHRIGAAVPEGTGLHARSPITGENLFALRATTAEETERAIGEAAEAFRTWRTTPAPVRGELVRTLGDLLRAHKSDLADLITIEAGKIRSEALGEVQEMIDICDFAVGLSRQLYGRTIASERPGHRLAETWHPLGVVGVVSAFNFPAAVWSWNTAIALVCGDAVVWKPSELTPLVSLAASHLLDRALEQTGAPRELHRLLLGGRETGELLVDDPRVSLVSATGSTRMGREIGPRVAARFGRVLLELGGNNATVVAPSADLDLALQGIVFAAAGTAGQRCTTLRRLIVHRDIADQLVERLAAAYGRLPIGDPFDEGTLVGPLITGTAADAMATALERAQAEGGKIVAGGRRVGTNSGAYVEPAIVRMPKQTGVVREETFAPILYVLTYDTFEQAVALQNDVPQGLSSSIFTRDQQEAERFLAADGSDCGIANVNIGTSGAEIGGAFGGEKETGGGRESGSDAWRAYMRRATNTINYSSALALAQNVSFL